MLVLVREKATVDTVQEFVYTPLSYAHWCASELHMQSYGMVLNAMGMVGIKEGVEGAL